MGQKDVHSHEHPRKPRSVKLHDSLVRKQSIQIRLNPKGRLWVEAGTDDVAPHKETAGARKIYTGKRIGI